jgi:hypothetical protein
VIQDLGSPTHLEEASAPAFGDPTVELMSSAPFKLGIPAADRRMHSVRRPIDHQSRWLESTREPAFVANRTTPTRLLVSRRLAMKYFALAAAAVLALAANSTFAGPSAATHGKVVAPPQSTFKPACGTGFGTDSGTGIASESFAASNGFDNYDSYGAADFVVKGFCLVHDVHVLGQYFNGSGPASSVDVVFYKNSHGHPGKVVKAYMGLPYTDSTGFGSFNVNLPSRLGLVRGRYWISVSAEIDFFTGGQWGWELQNEAAGGTDGQWEEAGGFGTGCTTWTDVNSCVGFGNDFMFELSGRGR